MREMLADMGSKFFVEVVDQKCVKLHIVWLECMWLSVHSSAFLYSDVNDL